MEPLPFYEVAGNEKRVRWAVSSLSDDWVKAHFVAEPLATLDI
jgi:hypothetical protein